MTVDWLIKGKVSWAVVLNTEGQSVTELSAAGWLPHRFISELRLKR